MNEHAAYINQAIVTCDGVRVFVPPGYGYDATERIILGYQTKSVRDCYWFQMQDEMYDVHDIGGYIHEGHLPPQPMSRYELSGAPPGSYQRPLYR